MKDQIEIAHKERLNDDCYKTENGIQIPKTKTATIAQRLSKPEYQRKPAAELLKCSRQDTKAIIIARYGMLECGKNYKGTLPESCVSCNTTDDKNH